LLAAGALLAACGGGGRPAAPTATPFVAEGTPYKHPCPPGGFSERVSVSQYLSVNGVGAHEAEVQPMVVARGEPVTMTLSIANCSNGPVKVSNPTSQRYEFLVEDRQGREVWRWSQDRVFLQVTGEDEVQSVTHSEVWDQRDNSGQPVAPRVYVVRAWMTGTLEPAPACAPDCGKLALLMEVTP
jgi:hypothetical protein